MIQMWMTKTQMQVRPEIMIIDMEEYEDELED